MAPNTNNRRGRRGNRPVNQQHRQRSHNSTNSRSHQRSSYVAERPQRKRHYGCGICQADHRLINCKKFSQMNLAQKYKTAVKLHYCINCLARNHLIGKCSSQTRCQKCGGKHHSILHGPQRILQHIPTTSTPVPTTRAQLAPIPAPRILTTSGTVSTALPSSRTKTFVPTAVIKINTDKRDRLARALLNPSLTTSRIAVSFVREVDLPLFKVDGQMYVKAVIAPNMSSTVKYEICMLVVNELPKTPYPGSIEESVKEKFPRISLADPEFYSNTPVVVEIGGDLYTSILKSNVIQIDGGSLVAQDSTLGWLVMGSISH